MKQFHETILKSCLNIEFVLKNNRIRVSICQYFTLFYLNDKLFMFGFPILFEYIVSYEAGFPAIYKCFDNDRTMCIDWFLFVDIHRNRVAVHVRFISIEYS